MPTYIHHARKLKCRDPGADAQKAAEDDIIEQARDILLRRASGIGHALNAPAAVRDYLILSLSDQQAEQFWCIMLDAQNRVISAEQLFTGTLTQTSVYPREVVKAALNRNAAAVIFAHNHPSGIAEPSHADQVLTQALKQALSLIDVKVLDHFIIAGVQSLSFAERGLI